MLRGMRDTTMAEGKAHEDMEEMAQMLNAISDHPTEHLEIIATTNEVKTSSIKKWGGRYLSINDDT